MRAEASLRERRENLCSAFRRRYLCRRLGLGLWISDLWISDLMNGTILDWWGERMVWLGQLQANETGSGGVAASLQSGGRDICAGGWDFGLLLELWISDLMISDLMNGTILGWWGERIVCSDTYKQTRQDLKVLQPRSKAVVEIFVPEVAILVCCWSCGYRTGGYRT